MKLDTPCTFQSGKIRCLGESSLTMDGVVLLSKGVLTAEGKKVVDKPERRWWRR